MYFTLRSNPVLVLMTSANQKKILYATRVDVFSKTAQSVQVNAMIEAFLFTKGANSIIFCGNKCENTWLPPFRPLKNKFFNIAKFCFFIAILLIANPRIVVITRDIPVALVSCFFLKKCCLEVHKPYKNGFFRSALYFFTRLGLMKIVAISKGLKNKLQDDLSIPGERIVVAHDGCFFASQMESRMDELSSEVEAAFKGSNTKIVHTGSLYKGGQHELLKLCEIIQTLNCTLVHVGGSRLECDNLVSLTTEYQNVFFIPGRDINEVYRIQKNADIFFYINPQSSPYYNFTSPLKLFEYLAWKKPILATTGGAPDEIISESVAYLYAEGDYLNLEKQLKIILNDLGRQNFTRHMDDYQIAQNHWVVRCKNIIDEYI